MKEFVVAVEHKTGRVFIDEEALLPEKGVSIIQRIKSENWIEAREQVNDLSYDHRKGYGWFQ